MVRLFLPGLTVPSTVKLRVRLVVSFVDGAVAVVVVLRVSGEVLGVRLVGVDTAPPLSLIAMPGSDLVRLAFRL